MRLAILDGKTDEAMHWIETGLVMGRHVSQGPLVIQALVGVAIGRTMTRCLEDLIQAPGGPSLYWALADRPRPFIDMRRAMEGERYVLEKELPELNELDRGRGVSIRRGNSPTTCSASSSPLPREDRSRHDGAAADRTSPTCPAGSASPRWPPRSTPRPNAP